MIQTCSGCKCSSVQSKSDWCGFKTWFWFIRIKLDLIRLIFNRFLSNDIQNISICVNRFIINPIHYNSIRGVNSNESEAIRSRVYPNQVFNLNQFELTWGQNDSDLFQLYIWLSPMGARIDSDWNFELNKI